MEQIGLLVNSLLNNWMTISVQYLLLFTFDHIKSVISEISWNWGSL